VARDNQRYEGPPSWLSEAMAAAVVGVRRLKAQARLTASPGLNGKVEGRAPLTLAAPVTPLWGG